jgi:hypothetical protein
MIIGTIILSLMDNRLQFKMEVKVKFSLSLTNKALRHESLWGSECIDPRFLDLGSSCR